MLQHMSLCCHHIVLDLEEAPLQEGEPILCRGGCDWGTCVGLLAHAGFDMEVFVLFN